MDFRFIRSRNNSVPPLSISLSPSNDNNDDSTRELTIVDHATMEIRTRYRLPLRTYFCMIHAGHG